MATLFLILVAAMASSQNASILTAARSFMGLILNLLLSQHAKTYSSAENIKYFNLDAIQQPFPCQVSYDVVIWDGAIGHFSPEGSNALLQKIVSSLEPNGIFTGSESLGNMEGSDRLQFFMNLPALAARLEEHFKHVEMREIFYPIGQEGFMRHEGYWRCSTGGETEGAQLENV